jgi:hypothetical protein
MSLLDWFTKRKKPLSELSRTELRRQELLLEKDRTRMLNRIRRLAANKKKLFEEGAREKTPEIRRALAQEFELRTTEQLMVSRQLNTRSKEILTVSRLRMLRESSDRAKSGGGVLGLVSERDILKIGKLIESDSIRSEVYQERLDEILRIGAEVDEGSSGLSAHGSEVMDIWNKMDSGAISDTAEAFDEADRRVREQQRAAAEE